MITKKPIYPNQDKFTEHDDGVTAEYTIKDAKGKTYNPVNSAAVAQVLSDLGIGSSESFRMLMSFGKDGHDIDFMIIATAVIRINGPYSLNNPIDIEILETGGHGSSFVLSVTGTSAGVTLIWPKVKNAFPGIMGVDELTATKGLICGPSIDFESGVFKIGSIQPARIKLQGDGGTGWNKSGPDAGKFTVSSFDGPSGLTTIQIEDLEGDVNFDYSTAIVYAGSNNYSIEQKFSGLGNESVGFYLINNATGARIITAIATDDYIIIPSGAMVHRALRLDVWKADTEYLASGSANFFYFGMFEAYMVALALSTTEIKVKWQAFPAATNYKIFRDDDPGFGTEVKIFEGVAFEFKDTGLDPATIYYYKMVATVTGDEDVAFFNAITK